MRASNNYPGFQGSGNDLKWLPSEISGLVTTGNVYYVIQAAETYYNQFLSDFSTTYTDGSVSIYNTIQAALNACVSGRGDYVIVVPSATDYSSGTGITMSVNNVHLICPTGIGGRVGATPRSATIAQPSPAADTISISGRGVEVAGFWIRGGTEKAAINFTSSAATGSWIHHNEIAIYSTSSSGTLASGITDGVGVAGLVVEKNHVFTNSGTGATIVAGIQCIAGSTRAIISDNQVDVSNGCTMTAGIKNLAVMGMVSNNFVCAHQASGSGEGAGVLTKGIRLGLGTVAINNRVTISTASDALVGGTTDKGGVLNYDSASGGTLIDVT